MEFIFRKSDKEEVYSYVHEFVDGYGFSGIYIDRKNNIRLIYAPEDRNAEIVELFVSREFVRENKYELNAGESLKEIAPLAIAEDRKNLSQVPFEYFDDKDFLRNCIAAATPKKDENDKKDLSK